MPAFGNRIPAATPILCISTPAAAGLIKSPTHRQRRRSHYHRVELFEQVLPQNLAYINRVPLKTRPYSAAHTNTQNFSHSIRTRTKVPAAAQNSAAQFESTPPASA